MVPKVRSLTQN